MTHHFHYVPNGAFAERYVSPQKLHRYLLHHYKDYLTEVGKSTFGQPIYMLSLGKGNCKVIGWSQMHGNESTATLAMLDLLHSLEESQFERLLKNLSLDFIFMLNPDGSEKWTRRNGLDIDINRDYLKESSPEIRVLKQVLSRKKYDYALNLHDQRTLFSTDGEHPASLSFLAPSFNKARDLNETRKKSMAVIAHIYTCLKEKIPHRIGRYSDEFYPKSMGDNLVLAGIPAILFEGGHSPKDYLRQETRKYYTLALYYALAAMAMLEGNTFNYESYFQIPENKEDHYDIIYRNLKLQAHPEVIADVAVNYREVKEKNKEEISFIPIVVEMGDLSEKKAWKDIEASGKTIDNPHNRPRLNEEFHF